MAVYLVRSCARCGAYFGIASDVGIGLRGLWFEGRRRSLVRDACLKSRLIDSSLIEAVNLRTRYAGVVPEVKVKPMSDFAVHFDSEPFESLDQLALLACQDYNLGGESDWFGEFRGGLYGFYARLYGEVIIPKSTHGCRVFELQRKRSITWHRSCSRWTRHLSASP